MPRRRYFGTINSLGKDSSGVKMWRLRWHEQGVRRSEIVHGAYRDAEKRLAVIHARVDDRKKAGPTVAEIYTTYYLPDAAKTKAPRTRRRLESVWRNHIEPRWGNVHVTSVKAADVEPWLQTIAPGSAKDVIAVLRWIMRKAVMLEHIDASPLEMPLTLPKEPQKRQSHSIITSATIDAYYAAVRGTDVEAAWILCIAGGLRPGESLGVMVGEIEHREMDGVPFAAVPASRQAEQYGGVHIDDRTNSARLKTATSSRWAIVMEPWASRLIELQKAAESRKDVYITDDGLGQPQGTNWLYRTLRNAYESSGLPWVTVRNLRASFATAARYERGLPTEDVARLMGHSKPVITWSVYERPDLDQIAAAVVKGGRTIGHE